MPAQPNLSVTNPIAAGRIERAVSRPNPLPDIERVQKLQERSVLMLSMMHRALRDIADCDCAINRELCMKSIAADCLIEIEQLGEEVANV